MSAPLVSVVVTVVDGGAALQRCLAALSSQADPPPMEVLVPYDASIRSVAALAVRYPAAQFLDMGPVTTVRPASSAAGQHELIDRRRAAGLAAARGDIVALVEDRGVPRADWVATAVRLHGGFSNLVIGGAVQNARDRLLNWAVYFCDFGRYQLPFAAGSRHDVSDVNVTYKRRALEASRDIWEGGYHEPLVHRAIERTGEKLLLSPDLVVDEIRDDLTLRSLIAERFAWGRLYGCLRVRDASSTRRVVFAALSPLIPGVLFVRFVRYQVVKGTPLGRLLRVMPVVVLLLCAWTAGEAAGYVTARP